MVLRGTLRDPERWIKKANMVKGPEPMPKWADTMEVSEMSRLESCGDGSLGAQKCLKEVFFFFNDDLG